MKKIKTILIALVVVSCSSSDDSNVNLEDNFSIFKIEFSKSGNLDEWFEELEFKTSVDGWKISNSNNISDGDLDGSEVTNNFTIESKSRISELTISYLATPYFDGVNFLDNSEPTFLNVAFKVYENNVLIDTKTLNLDGSIQATKDFEFKYLVQ